MAKDSASNEKDYALKNPKWSTAQARVGEEIELTVQCENVYNGANVYFAVWNEGANRETDAPVKKIVGRNEGGEARVRWKYFVPKDLEEPLTRKPSFVFTAEAFRCELVESDTVEMGADIYVKCVDMFGEPIKNTKYELVGLDRAGNTGEEGIVDEKDVIPGQVVMFKDNEQ